MIAFAPTPDGANGVPAAYSVNALPNAGGLVSVTVSAGTLTAAPVVRIGGPANEACSSCGQPIRSVTFTDPTVAGKRIIASTNAVPALANAKLKENRCQFAPMANPPLFPLSTAVPLLLSPNIINIGLPTLVSEPPTPFKKTDAVHV